MVLRKFFICKNELLRIPTFNVIFFLDSPKPLVPVINDIYGYEGGKINLTCEVSSNPQANFTWYRNESIFSGEEENVTIINVEKNKSILQINYINDTRFETYVCTAENQKGGTDIIFNVKKLPKPEPPKKTKIHSMTYNSLQLEIHPPPAKEEEVIGYRVQLMEQVERQKGREWEVARIVFLPKGNFWCERKP